MNMCLQYNTSIVLWNMHGFHSKRNQGTFGHSVIVNIQSTHLFAPTSCAISMNTQSLPAAFHIATRPSWANTIIIYFSIFLKSYFQSYNSCQIVSHPPPQSHLIVHILIQLEGRGTMRLEKKNPLSIILDIKLNEKKHTCGIMSRCSSSSPSHGAVHRYVCNFIHIS